MNKLFTPIIISCLLLLSGCAMLAPQSQGTRIDEVPMYGGMDRASVPALKEGDAKFIADATGSFGTREQSSRVYINQGYRYYKEDKLGMAMRRFNQAWLLNPKNPEVFTGFASVLNDQGKSCEAMAMMNKALALNPPSFSGVYPDAAKITVLCALNSKTTSPVVKAELLAKSESLYKQAEQMEPNKRYTYDSWALAYYWRGQYSDAWRMVAKSRASASTSGVISDGATQYSPPAQSNERFLNMLRKKMPEPA